MHILSKPDTQPVYPYSFGKLRQDNPSVSFIQNMTDEQYAKFHMFPVQPTKTPQFNSLTQKLEEGIPTLVDGVWQQTWKVVALTDAEKTLGAAKRQSDINRDSKEYLASTDWYVTRKAETGVEIPANVITKRAAARDAIV